MTRQLFKTDLTKISLWSILLFLVDVFVVFSYALKNVWKYKKIATGMIFLISEVAEHNFWVKILFEKLSFNEKK